MCVCVYTQIWHILAGHICIYHWHLASGLALILILILILGSTALSLLLAFALSGSHIYLQTVDRVCIYTYSIIFVYSDVARCFFFVKKGSRKQFCNRFYDLTVLLAWTQTLWLPQLPPPQQARMSQHIKHAALVRVYEYMLIQSIECRWPYGDSARRNLIFHVCFILLLSLPLPLPLLLLLLLCAARFNE